MQSSEATVMGGASCWLRMLRLKEVFEGYGDF